jgi:uncharacterized cupin superfamily protein
MSKFYVSSLQATDYESGEPDGGQDVLEGDVSWQVHTVRKTDGPGGYNWTGLVVGQPSITKLDFDVNETVVVLEGEADVQVDGDDVVELRPGVVASFVKGTQTVWTIKKQLKQVFVMSG